MDKQNNQIVLFKTEDGKISVDVRFGEETAWLSLDQMAELFERDKSTISRHIKNVFVGDCKTRRRKTVGAGLVSALVRHKSRVKPERNQIPGRTQGPPLRQPGTQSGDKPCFTISYTPHITYLIRVLQSPKKINIRRHI